MALALDEPQDDDEQIESEGITFLVAPDVSKLVKTYGSVTVDYKDYPWGGQITVKASGAAEC